MIIPVHMTKEATSDKAIIPIALVIEPFLLCPKKIELVQFSQTGEPDQELRKASTSVMDFAFAFPNI